MTDIVEQLRKWANVAPDVLAIEVPVDTLCVAADEIERLRSIIGAARVDPGFREITHGLRAGPRTRPGET